MVPGKVSASIYHTSSVVSRKVLKPSIYPVGKGLVHRHGHLTFIHVRHVLVCGSRLKDGMNIEIAGSFRHACYLTPCHTMGEISWEMSRLIS
jgi:hypothetical protein